MKYFLLLLSFVSLQTAHAQLSDIDGHVHEDAIWDLYDEGIIDGYDDGTYKPDQTINRAEFVKIITGVHQEFLPETWEDSMCISVMSDPTMDFPLADVKKDDWFASHVCYGLSQQLLHGYPDGTFRPANPINYAEAAKITTGVFGLQHNPSTPGTWYTRYIIIMDRYNAAPRNDIEPADMITRGEMAHIISSLLFVDEGDAEYLYEDDFGFATMTADDCYDDEYYDEQDQYCYLDEDSWDDNEDYADALDADYAHGDHDHETDDLPDGSLYDVNGNEITLVSGEVYPADSMIWEHFTKLVPAQNRTKISQFLVYDEDDDTSAFVTLQADNDNSAWVLAVNISDAAFDENEEVTDWKEFNHTMIHEFAHVMTLNDTQVNTAIDEDSCHKQYHTGEGCALPNSFVNAYVQKFWSVREQEATEDTEFGSELYDINPDDFVSEYAATNPGEDIAESFTYFVYGAKPTDTTHEKHQKIAFFYEYKSLVALRQKMRQVIHP